MTRTYLKDRYQKHLWTFIGLNVTVFWLLLITDGKVLEVFDRLSETSLTTGLLALVSPIVVIVLNGLFTPTAKARLVFLRWRHPLPGSRAFSKYAIDDHRVNVDRLPETPSTPEGENRAWYKMYREVDNELSVLGAHHAFLFARDICALGFLFFVMFSPTVIAALSDLSIAISYAACLLIQYALAAVAAGNYGRRFVTNVLAVATS